LPLSNRNMQLSSHKIKELWTLNWCVIRWAPAPFKSGNIFQKEVKNVTKTSYNESSFIRQLIYRQGRLSVNCGHCLKPRFLCCALKCSLAGIVRSQALLLNPSDCFRTATDPCVVINYVMVLPVHHGFCRYYPNWESDWSRNSKLVFERCARLGFLRESTAFHLKTLLQLHT
jgi:hypothetical protein